MRDPYQRALPFPTPPDATPWPNGLGFDYLGLEFWTDKNGVRDLEAYVYGVGKNWVAALADMVNNPKDIQ